MSPTAFEAPPRLRSCHRRSRLGRPSGGWMVDRVPRPSFGPTGQPCEFHVAVSSSRNAYAKIAGRCPLDATPRACFALDQRVASLPAWSMEGGVAVADVRRSCFLVVAPSRIGVFGDPSTRRWRFTLQLVFQEIAATRARRTDLDIHAAAIEVGGRAILIAGPKRAGKTTLFFHLLRWGGGGWNRERSRLRRGRRGGVHDSRHAHGGEGAAVDAR